MESQQQWLRQYGIRVFPHIPAYEPHQCMCVTRFLFFALTIRSQHRGSDGRLHNLANFFLGKFSAFDPRSAANRSHDIESVKALLNGRWNGDSPNHAGQSVDLSQIHYYVLYAGS